MEAICKKDADARAEEISHPIINVISRAAGNETLAVFVDHAKDAEKNDGNKVKEEGRRLVAAFQEPPGAEDDSAREEIGEVGELVEVGNLLSLFRSRAGKR